MYPPERSATGVVRLPQPAAAVQKRGGARGRGGERSSARQGGRAERGGADATRQAGAEVAEAAQPRPAGHTDQRSHPPGGPGAHGGRHAVSAAPHILSLFAIGARYGYILSPFLRLDEPLPPH
eukprot:8841522-Pyramimonas_sp.AAC.1